MVEQAGEHVGLYAAHLSAPVALLHSLPLVVCFAYDKRLGAKMLMKRG
jgi:hypothetical protein